MTENRNLSFQTPDIDVLNPQGQIIRQLRYHRTEAAQPTAERIERHVFHVLGHLACSQDARFFAEVAGPCNVHHHTSLSGKVLHTQSVDAGDCHLFCDIEGRPVWQRDARGTIQRYQYDSLGRPVARYETTEGMAATRIAERWVYGEALADAALRNARGQWVRHFDTAGLLDHSQAGYAINGGPLQQQRRLLAGNRDSHWPGNHESDWALALASDRYTTAWQCDLKGQMLVQTDARGHHQRNTYDVAGRLKASWVQLRGGQEQAVLLSINYSAAGQTLREQAGNGVVTEYRYEAQTQRLLEVKTTRAASGDRKTLLQRLRYSYDPVGNLLSVHNDAEAVRFFKNQRVTPDQFYRYDSLYQLIEVKSREQAAALSFTDHPAFTPLDSENYVNYLRSYRYDAGGNLITMTHRGAETYTRHLTVSSTSNRAISARDGLLPAEVHTYFDATGNQTRLDTGQTLAWNGLNQLQRVITLPRHSGHDGECYVYGGDGLRVKKTCYAMGPGSVVHQQGVIYLPGLELRVAGAEQWEVLTLGATGCSQVRLLNWLAGKPAEIANQQLRYSLDNHLGSSQLELDEEGNILTREEYYPYGGTAVRAAKSASEVKYKTVRYSGKERDASGLYYYGYRYYQPWLGRWLSPDPAQTIDGLNFFRMVRNNPIVLVDSQGLMPKKAAAEKTGKTAPAVRPLLLPHDRQLLLTETFWENELDTNQRKELASSSSSFWKDKFPGKTKETVKNRRLQDILLDLGPKLLSQLDDRKDSHHESLSLFRAMEHKEANDILLWDVTKKISTENWVRKGKVTAYTFRQREKTSIGIGIIPVKNHFGDRDQANYFYEQGRNRMLEFRLKPGAEALLFTPEYLAIARSGKGARAIVSRLGTGFLNASHNEGVLPGYIGVKSEEHGPFSLGVGKSDPSRLLFQLMIESIHDVDGHHSTEVVVKFREQLNSPEAKRRSKRATY